MRRRRGTAVLAGCLLSLASLQVVGAGASTGSTTGTPTVSADVAEIVANDDTANLDGDGLLYYVDPAPELPNGVVQPQRSESSTAQAGLAIPNLSSRSSAHTIYLDFDGVDLPASSAWTTIPSTPIVAGTYTGFTLDGSPDYTQTEIDYIQKVWRIVAEKYSPFDVNVTTVDPGIGALARTSPSDDSYGVQVVVTNDPSPVTQVCGNSCAGIAYNGLFDGRIDGTVYNSSNHTIAWVFSSKTGGSAQLTALDAAHEVGHTLGLDHDGDATHAYYSGHANWVPIMGITNQNAISQFSKGEYAGANNLQDDLAVIGANDLNATGSFLLADDYGTTGGAPTALNDLPSYALDGVISNAADDDLFSVVRTCTSALAATATGIGSGQAVDLKVEILDDANAVLASNDPPSSPNASQVGDIGFVATGINATASIPSTSAGTTYRIRVNGVGSANPLNTGYSDYGSIGGYHLTITGCPPGGPTIPSTPASISATPGSHTTTGTINWTAPVSDGASPITGYQVTGLPIGTLELGDVHTYNATGLVAGQTYNVAVKARNAIGLSAVAATTTIKVLTWAPTAKPTLTASIDGTTASVSWSPPANPGNAVLNSWTVDRTGPGSNPVDKTVAQPATSTTMTGLAVGSHSFTVTGNYTADDPTAGVASDTQSVTVAVPGVPTNLSTTPGSHTTTGTVDWDAPASPGSGAITGYQLSGLPVGTLELGDVHTYDATDLIPGTSYDVEVRARNAAGLSGAVATGTLRVSTWAPTTKPGLSVTLSGTTATLTMTAPANPGTAPLTGWSIHRVGPGTTPADKATLTSAAISTTTMSGLAIGKQTFTVTPTYTADDTAGIQISDPKFVTVIAKPSAPKIGTAASGAAGGTKSATAKWSAPSSTGGSAITSYKVFAYKVVKGKVTKTITSTARPATARSYVFKLAGGTYKFRVVAYNKAGGSPYSSYSKVVTSR